MSSPLAASCVLQYHRISELSRSGDRHGGGRVEQRERRRARSVDMPAASLLISSFHQLCGKSAGGRRLSSEPRTDLRIHTDKSHVLCCFFFTVQKKIVSPYSQLFSHLRFQVNKLLGNSNQTQNKMQNIKIQQKYCGSLGISQSPSFIIV